MQRRKISDGANVQRSGMITPMPRPKQLPDEVFVRMPPGTKALMEQLSGTSPTPSAWVRQTLIEVLRQKAAAQGLVDPFPKDDD